ncbi:hypothetical protein B0H21DRAFT_761066 [Amylocystis lapponica]|nr:hypothetical protein B0H21DRAFT_761066 [Amylocystis lapponica]
MVDTLECAAYFVVAVFSALRVYAIRDQSMLWASAVLVLALVPFATNIYNFSRDHAYHSALGCEMISTISITTRVCAIAVDFLLLFATLLTTFGIRFPTNMHSRMSLMTMVLRDGKLVQFPLLSSMLISRFVLDLRQVHLYNGGLSTSSFAPPDADMRSASGIIGNMGAPLRAGGTGSFSDMHSLTWADDDVEEVPRVAREPFKADLEFADVGENIDSDTVINPDLHVADGCEEIEMAEVNGEAGAASSV